MSKIVVLFYLPYFSKKLPSYYDQFILSLSINHDVLVVNNFDKSQLANFINEEQCQGIVDFNPDLIITFNRSILFYGIRTLNTTVNVWKGWKSVEAVCFNCKTHCVL
jgi:hypothetical protein